MKKSWGVRRGMGTALASVERSANPTEEIIAKEIRELKEREEELIRLREEKGNTEEEEEELKKEDEEEVSATEEPEPPVKFITNNNNFRPSEQKPINNNRWENLDNNDNYTALLASGTTCKHFITLERHFSVVRIPPCTFAGLGPYNNSDHIHCGVQIPRSLVSEQN